MWISKKHYKEDIKRTHDEGLGRGFTLGYNMGMKDALKGLHSETVSKVIQEAEEILRKKQGGKR